MIRAYDANASIGRIPLYPGSAFPVADQWTWHGIQIPLTVVVTVGLFRGWRWARWLALAVFVVASVVAAPLWDLRAAPSYVFLLTLNVVAYVLLFLIPGATVYFSRSSRPERAFAWRGALGTTLLIFAIFTAHSIGFASLWKNGSAEYTWGSTAIFLVPTLALSALVRWDLQRSARETAAALMAVTVALASSQVTAFILVVRGWQPVATLRLGWRHSLLLTVALGFAALALAAWAVRARKIAAT